MRVLQVLHQGGGAGSVTSTLHLSVALARRGAQVRFVCPPNSEVEQLAREAGLEVLPLLLRPHSRRGNARALAALLARYPVDLVNSQSGRDRGALTWLGLTGRLKVPLVITRRQMPKSWWLDNWLAGRVADRVIAVSRAVAVALAGKGTPPEKLEVVHNGLVTERVDRPVSASEVEQWRERIGWEPSRRTIGIVARPKDQAVVLRALHHLRTPVRLVLSGVDPAGPLAAPAREVPERHAVILLPFDSAVRPLYDLLELALLPSEMEGLSQALLEGMALGKPVIASASTGNLEVITDETDGLLVPPREPLAWGRAIDRLLEDRDLAARLGAAARRTARERFSLERTLDATEAVYRKVLGGRSPSG